MLRKIKYSKIAVVVFLTILIWVWADLATNEVSPDKPATILVDESANPNLWVSFSQASSAGIRIILSGPHSAIAAEETRLRAGGRLDFAFDASQEEMDKVGNHDLKLLPFLQRDPQLKYRGLKVESCDLEKLEVNVVELVSKSLTVQCFDESGIPQKAESIEPSKIDMLVPADWEGEKLIARVRLTRSEIEEAKSEAIEEKPYVPLAEGHIREATTAVKIKMSPEEDPLKSYTVQNATLGYCFSANLQGQYKVTVTNLDEVISPIAIRATPEAKQAYESMPYQVILEINDEDVKGEPRRKVVYYFPEEYVREKQIVLDQPQVTARFSLTPLPSAESP